MNVYYCKRGTTHTRRSKYTICLKKGFSLFSKKNRTERLCKKGLVSTSSSCIFVSVVKNLRTPSFVIKIFEKISSTSKITHTTRKKKRTQQKFAHFFFLSLKRAWIIITPDSFFKKPAVKDTQRERGAERPSFCSCFSRFIRWKSSEEREIPSFFFQK